MMNTINWLLASSDDPSKVSMFITNLTFFAVFFGIDKTVAESAGNSFVSILVGAGMIYTAIRSLYGLYRKVWVNGRWSAATPQ